MNKVDPFRLEQWQLCVSAPAQCLNMKTLGPWTIDCQNLLKLFLLSTKYFTIAVIMSVSAVNRILKSHSQFEDALL